MLINTNNSDFVNFFISCFFILNKPFIVFVLIGNFAEALYASFAICSETPSTSNRILPGFTLQA